MQNPAEVTFLSVVVVVVVAFELLWKAISFHALSLLSLPCVLASSSLTPIPSMIVPILLVVVIFIHTRAPYRTQSSSKHSH